MSVCDNKDVETRKGIARIKKEFLIQRAQQVINLAHVTDEQAATLGQDPNNLHQDSKGEKRERIDDRDRDPSEKKRLKGQNKHTQRYKIGNKVFNRKQDNGDGPREKLDKSTRLCLKYVEGDGMCRYSDKCEYSHNLHKIYKLNEELYYNEPCFIYSSYGRCHFGVACMYAKNHTKVLDDKNLAFNLIDHHMWSINGGRESYLMRYTNRLEPNVQHLLRKRKYDFRLVNQALNIMYKAEIVDKKDDSHKDVDNTKEDSEEIETKSSDEKQDNKRIGAALVDQFLSGRDYERKRVDFKDKLYLAPLTTVGNLPFRRLCKKYKCDITCAEMSLCTSLLNGTASEWSHIKRHESEDVFGVQITSNHPEHTTKIVKVLKDQCDVDFIDFNCGCPTDAIYQSGSGAGLMGKTSKLRKMLAGACMVSNVPITVKMRAGCVDEKNIAHNIINSVIRPFTSKYIGAITVHGRSRQQRYTKLADWHYINECGRFTDDIPLIGSGDCISWQEYYENLKKYKNVSGVMIARGALISPWLFTEIKERRTWDISSSERLEIIKDYVNFGLDHWGSDATGIENCRKYLLEWLSFACRYIPAGLLEVLPQRVNERPPLYKGRDELETLLSSPAASDWVKISEMFLGKVPDSFKFLPKHKANAYESVVEG